MRATAIPAVEARSAGDLYVRALFFVLLGYVLLGKGFAYVGVPPLFVGEFIVLGGVVVALRTGCLPITLTTLPGLLLAALMMWVLLRTLPFVNTYGIDALRDSVIVLYGALGLVVCALIVDSPGRLNELCRLLGLLALIFGPGAWLWYFGMRLLQGVIPLWPGSNVPMAAIRQGEVAVHVTGAAVFTLVFLERISLLRSTLLFLSIALVAAQSRGAMVASIPAICVAALVSGRYGQLLRFGAIAVVALIAGYASGIELTLEADNRPISVEQLVINAFSIFGASDAGNLEATKLWRIRWWETIQGYTLHGPYFWTGKGFGVNLAVDDGFVVGLESGGPPLRSPHSANMTVLARSGVPGLLLWASLIGTWLWLMVSNMVRARLRGERDWANLFLYVACYFTAIVVDASFDVALEGPMLGIWFWTLFGIGCGAAIVYRARAD